MLFRSEAASTRPDWPGNARPAAATGRAEVTVVPTINTNAHAARANRFLIDGTPLGHPTPNRKPTRLTPKRKGAPGGPPGALHRYRHRR